MWQLRPLFNVLHWSKLDYLMTLKASHFQNLQISVWKWHWNIYQNQTQNDQHVHKRYNWLERIKRTRANFLFAELVSRYLETKQQANLWANGKWHVQIIKYSVLSCAEIFFNLVLIILCLLRFFFWECAGNTEGGSLQRSCGMFAHQKVSYSFPLLSQYMCWVKSHRYETCCLLESLWAFQYLGCRH